MLHFKRPFNKEMFLCIYYFRSVIILSRWLFAGLYLQSSRILQDLTSLNIRQVKRR